MFHHFGILDPSVPAFGDTGQKPFFGGRDDAPTRAERELAVLTGGYPFTLAWPDEDRSADEHRLRFVSLFVPPGA